MEQAPTPNEIPTAWISQVSDEALKNQELTWGSPKNAESPEGQVLYPLIKEEMARRGLKGYLDQTTEEIISQVVELGKKAEEEK